MKNVIYLGTSSIDNAFQQYWVLLTRNQKEALLQTVKSFAIAEEEVNLYQYNKEIHDVIERLDTGGYWGHEDVINLLNLK
jgi:hypothetical protein